MTSSSSSSSSSRSRLFLEFLTRQFIKLDPRLDVVGHRWTAHAVSAHLVRNLARRDVEQRLLEQRDRHDEVVATAHEALLDVEGLVVPAEHLCMRERVNSNAVDRRSNH